MTDEQKQKQRDYQKEYRKNMTDEQKQTQREAIKIHQKKYREAKKRYRENMTDEQKQNEEIIKENIIKNIMQQKS